MSATENVLLSKARHRANVKTVESTLFLFILQTLLFSVQSKFYVDIFITFSHYFHDLSKISCAYELFCIVKINQYNIKILFK